jgi:putative restriction endonuclease
MKMFLSLTDSDWFNNLRQIRPTEINFWLPGKQQGFQAVEPGELLLFKLHSPDNYVVGGGFFLRYLRMPTSVAWNAYGLANGTKTREELFEKIYKYRKSSRKLEPDPDIGCVLLAQPFFFSEDDWLPVPENWSKNIVRGKRYDTTDSIGRQLFENISYHFINSENIDSFPEEELKETLDDRFGKEQIIRPRLGQASFRLVVLDAYSKRCAITGEKTIPVLEAAHIVPYGEGGKHLLENGLSLRADFHTLFDAGYITVDPTYKVHVSRRIHEEFGNGKEYYAYNGANLLVLPQDEWCRPSSEYLEWHNDVVFAR